MIRISEVSALLREKKLSCRELTEKYLTAAKAENEKLNAYISITEEAATTAADAVDAKIAAGEELSPIAGVPFVLKDNICTSGMKTTCASRMLENHTPIYDAEVWHALKERGAVLIGKGNMDEFAMGSTCETSYFGGAKNPHDLNRVAGGSSGGSAAAVAGGLAVYGIGSDTGGSVRQPASFCGLVGLKPTYGAVSRRGLIAYASSFDQIGPITSCTEDAALVLDAISAKDPLDMTSRGLAPVFPQLKDDIRGMRIGVAPEFFEGLSEDVRRPIAYALEIYRTLGAEIVDVSFPSLKYSLPAYYILACAEASSNLGRYDGIRYGHCAEEFSNLEEMICKTRSEGFGKEVRRRILLGTYALSSGYFDAYYKNAQKIRGAIRAQLRAVLESCDALLTPTVPVTALPCGAGMSPVETYLTDICTVSVNIAGAPAVSLPCGRDSAGLPVGMQLIGRDFDEKTILSLSLAFERITDSAYLKASGLGVTSL